MLPAPVNLFRRTIPQPRVWALMIVVSHKTIDSYTCFSRSLVTFRVYILIFDGSPKALYEDIIVGTATVIHADPKLDLQDVVKEYQNVQLWMEIE